MAGVVRGDEGRDGVGLGLLDPGLRDAGARGLRGDAGAAAHDEADRRAQERRAGLPVDLAADVLRSSAGAFRPGDAVCPLRSYARQMRRLTGDCLLSAPG